MSTRTILIVLISLAALGMILMVTPGESDRTSVVSATSSTKPARIWVPVKSNRTSSGAGSVKTLKQDIKLLDYERARYHPLHFEPQIANASDAECLVCHKEILQEIPRSRSPAGVRADDTLAWYQTLDTYAGDQESFHYRHLKNRLARQVMNLSCNFCHRGNDPREESPDMQPGRPTFSASAKPNFTLRKMVNPSETCLLCHGAMPDPEIMGLNGPWHEVRATFEVDENTNGCLICHQQMFRTVRHQVSYLKADGIEKAAKTSSDLCYGCHGGRQWYRIAYPYPRHPWPGMAKETPEWAKDRPTESSTKYQLKINAAQQKESRS